VLNHTDILINKFQKKLYYLTDFLLTLLIMEIFSGKQKQGL